MKKTLLILVCLAFYLIPAVNGNYLFSQQREGMMSPSLQSASSAAYYYISRPGELTMQVNVWGYVHHPGRYEIPTNTDIIQLLSYAGGPIQDADMGEVKISRVITTDSLATHREIFVDLDDLSETGPKDLLLYPGDTIFIDRTGWSKFREVMAIVTSTAMVTTAITGVIITLDRLDR
jgi:hypothetical protein